MAYKLSAKAEEDIIRIYRESFRLFGADQAEKYYAGIERTFQFLSDAPEAARERTEITPPVRVHPYKSHIVVYLIEDSDDVLILRVRHAREDWKNDPG